MSILLSLEEDHHAKEPNKNPDYEIPRDWDVHHSKEKMASMAQISHNWARIVVWHRNHELLGYFRGWNNPMWSWTPLLNKQNYSWPQRHEAPESHKPNFLPPNKTPGKSSIGIRSKKIAKKRQILNLQSARISNCTTTKISDSERGNATILQPLVNCQKWH